MSEKIIDLRQLGDDFVVHYGGRLGQVNAYTFANSLVGLANSIRATNTVLNPCQDVEIAVEAVATLRGESVPQVIEQRARLQIVRAILERSSRLWEFVWHGNRISAPVVDQQFYDSLYSRSISLATGDILDVTLAIKQRPIGDTGIFENVGYEVRKVHGHVARPTQETVESAS